MFSRWLKLMLPLLIALLAACGAPPPPIVSQNLRGAIVPTRITSTPTPSETATLTPTPSETATLTPTPSETATLTPTPSETATLTPTPSETATLTPEMPTSEPTAEVEPIMPQANPITIGDSVRGEITEDIGELLYTFTANADDIITISMERDEGVTLDPLLILSDASGEILAENDDAFGVERSTSLIEGFVIPADGTYTIIAARFQRELGSTRGGFTLTLSAGEGDKVIVVPIAYGETVVESISDTQVYHYYEFEGAAGDVVTVEMSATSGNLDPSLLIGVFDANDELVTLAENDDIAENDPNSRIEAFTLPDDGFYLIIAKRFGEEDGASTGDFELTLTLEEAEPADDDQGRDPDAQTPNVLALAQDAIPLVMGQPQSVELDNSLPFVAFKFTAEEGAVISLAARTEGLQPLDLVATLISPDGRELGRSIGDAQNRIVGVNLLTLGKSGEYLFVVGQPPARARNGRIAVMLQNEPLRAEVANPLAAQEIGLGDSIEAPVTRDTFGLLYTFYLEQGRRVRVEVNSRIRTLGFVWTVSGAGSAEILAQGRRGETSEFDAPESGYYSLFVRHQLGAGVVVIKVDAP